MHAPLVLAGRLCQRPQLASSQCRHSWTRWPRGAPAHTARVISAAGLARDGPVSAGDTSASASPAADEDRRYTLGHYYGSTRPVAGQVAQLDHSERRRQRVVAEVVEAGRRLGIAEAQLRTNIAAMEALLPELSPDVNKMRAADWAKLAKDVNQVALMLVTLKTSYPGANVGRIVFRAPKLLLKSPEQVAADAEVVRRVLGSAPSVDAIVEEVPYLMEPAALAQSLSNVARWYNTKDPVSLIAKNPKLLLNVEEADLEADPLYGDEIYVEDVGGLAGGGLGLQRPATAAAGAAAATPLNVVEALA